MLTVNIKSYDEATDSFTTLTTDDTTGTAFVMPLPAALVPYIAKPLCDACEDLPFDLIDKSFTLTLPL